MLPNDETEQGCYQLVGIKAIGSAETNEIRLDTCITGMGLGILAHFQSQTEKFPDILNFLKLRQLPDGAWNCRHPRVKTQHSSLNTTLSVLEGLADLENNYPAYVSEIRSLRDPAIEFLLVHELFKSHTSGKIIHPQYTDISFPPRWKYNILSALDYLRSIKFPYDPRMADAINLVRSKENQGYYSKGKQMGDHRFFPLNKPRKPSEFNTLRALRVLNSYSKAR